jgi:DNA polymerase-1
VDNVNSTAQIIAALEGMGEVLTKRTDKGNVSVDNKVLLPLADMNDRFEELGAREPNPLAKAIIMSKRAGKWKSAYAENFLKFRDSNDFLHPSINQLQARTARMSITDPALQTLPKKDKMIRRAIVADEGHELVAADYKSMELRVLAAGAGVKEMLAAIREGRDLHDYTATLIYGPEFTTFQRGAAKAVGLGKVFGGGANTLSLQTGIPVAEVSYAIKEYERVYPEVKAFSQRLTREAYRNGFKVITASGRQLPVDRTRTYAVVNYWVQSTSRDIMAAAMMRCEEAGLDIRLPVHDEILAMAPKGEGEEVARELGRIMSTEFRGVRIDTDYEVKGASWGG